MPRRAKQRKEEDDDDDYEYQTNTPTQNSSKRRKKETPNFEQGLEEGEDDFTELRLKIKKIFPILQQSKYTVCFTGSGISSASGLPIYRGKNGIWTEYEKKRKKNGQLDEKEENRNGYKWLKGNSDSKLKHLWFPNYTHMAISELMKQNLVHFVISQNCDDLHFKSGIPMDKMVELHGNCFLEECRHCKTLFRRDFLVAQPKLVPHSPQQTDEDEEEDQKSTSTSFDAKEQHQTSRVCETCNNILYDTIINFSESLPTDKFQLASSHASKADVILVFGSSLAVEPANRLPLMGKKLVIINLDSTPLDDEAFVSVRAKSDRFFEQISGPEFLNFTVPSYQFELELKLEATLVKNKNKEIVTVQLSNESGTLDNIISKATLLPNITSLRLPLDFLPKNSYSVKFVCIDVVFNSAVEIKFNIRKHGTLSDWSDDTLLLPCSIRFDQNNGEKFEQRYKLVFDTSFYQQQEKVARSFWKLN